MKKKQIIATLTAIMCCMGVVSVPSMVMVSAAESTGFIGDINSDGKIDLIDLTEISLAILGDKTLTESQIKAADIDENGKADLPDLARMKQYLSNVITSLHYETPISKIADNDRAIILVDITDIATRDMLTTCSALEPFFEDEEYTYIFSSIVSQYIECTFSDGTKMNVKDALNKGMAKVSDLDKYGICYIKEAKY